MTTLKAEKRDMAVKAKKLRRDGFVPGNLCGRDMKESMPLQINMAEAERFYKNNKKGNQVTLQVGDQKINAIVKDTDYNPMKNQIMFIDFQQLVADEKILTTAQIVFVNEEQAQGNVEQDLEEISYKAYPADLVEEVIVDFAKMKNKRSVRVSDLELNNNDKIDIVTSADSTIANIIDSSAVIDADIEAADEAAAEAASTATAAI